MDDVGGEELAHGGPEQIGRKIGVLCHEPTVRPRHGCGRSSRGLSPSGEGPEWSGAGHREFSPADPLVLADTASVAMEAALLEPAVVDEITGYRYYERRPDPDRARSSTGSANSTSP